MFSGVPLLEGDPMAAGEKSVEDVNRLFAEVEVNKQEDGKKKENDARKEEEGEGRERSEGEK
jgi:hypothetical protein